MFQIPGFEPFGSERSNNDLGEGNSITRSSRYLPAARAQRHLHPLAVLRYALYELIVAENPVRHPVPISQRCLDLSIPCLVGKSVLLQSWSPSPSILGSSNPANQWSKSLEGATEEDSKCWSPLGGLRSEDFWDADEKSSHHSGLNCYRRGSNCW